jgi:hypothetical protein
MADLNKRKIVLIVDASGSMSSIKEATEEGINAFLVQQAKEDVETTVSAYTFSDAWTETYQNLPIAEVPPFVLTPTFGTALLDAVGDIFELEREERLALPKEQRPGSVHYVIATDGQENNSQRRTYPEVAKLLKKEGERKGRVIQYMGANQDAIATAAKIGVRAANSINYAASPIGTRGTWEAASESLSTGLEGGSYDYTPQMRSKAMGRSEDYNVQGAVATDVVGQVSKPEEE